MGELLWLLLPAAAASGWWAARRAAARAAPALPPGEYYRGLGFLLNEQPDKAIEVFLRVLEVDSDTVEIHLALGNLFRLRGEVDRAIRLHENLIRRPNLDPALRAQALHELALDHMKAGLYDRAEALFRELETIPEHAPRALRQLCELYQQEKEWERATECARRLQALTGEPQGPLVAHLLCERAEAARRAGRGEEAWRLLRQALREDPRCARASLLQGTLAAEQSDCATALRAFREVERQDPAYLPEVVAPLAACLRRAGEREALRAFLEELLGRRRGGVSALLALTALVAETEGREAALEVLRRHLREQPSLRGLVRLVELEVGRAEPPVRESLELAGQTLERLLRAKPVYRCVHCGFTGRVLHWRCPGCKRWGVVKPIQGLEGEGEAAA